MPYQFIGQKVRVIYTRTLVNIYSQQGNGLQRTSVHTSLVNMSRNDAHLPSYYNEYVQLSPAKYIWRAEHPPSLQQSSVGLEQNTAVPPETFYKSCDGLFNLQKTTEPQLFDRACRAAPGNEPLHCGFIEI